MSQHTNNWVKEKNRHGGFKKEKEGDVQVCVSKNDCKVSQWQPSHDFYEDYIEGTVTICSPRGLPLTHGLYTICLKHFFCGV